jgi:outer membrane protein assembly factor BamB
MVRAASIALSAALLLSCRRTPEVAPDREAVPKPPPDDAKPPKPPKPFEAPDSLSFDGKLVDLREHRVVKELLAPPLRVEASDEKLAYLEADDLDLKAFALEDGALRWTHKLVDKCKSLAIGGAAVSCVTDSAVRAISSANGAMLWTISLRGLDDVVADADHVFLKASVGFVRIHDAKTGAIVGSVTPPFVPDRGTLVLDPAGDGICMSGQDGTDYGAGCWDAHGTKRWTTKVALPKPPSKPVRYWDRRIARAHFVYGGDYGSVHGTAIVRMKDGAVVATLTDDVAALVETDDGMLDSVVTYAPDRGLLDATGTRLWTTPESFEVQGAARRVGDRILVVTHDSMTEGSTLLVFDRASGKVLWKQRIMPILVSHSAYWNDVELRMRGADEVVVHGIESAGDYLKTFAIDDGRETFSDVLSGWKKW